MQLPRGTFREIRKGVAIESLVHALDGEKFSGIANLSSQSLVGILVFKAGKCILVKVGNSRGDIGWDEVQKTGSEEVDAVLSVLDDAQIGLALEFNKPCRILKSGKYAPAPASHRPIQPASHEPPRTVQAQKAAAPVAPPQHPAISAPSPHHVPVSPPTPQSFSNSPPLHPHLFSKAAAAQVPPSPLVPASRHEDKQRPEEKDSPEKDHETSSFDDDLDTFDTMDIENVTDKIRTDCKTIIKQLHLDHLMER